MNATLRERLLEKASSLKIEPIHAFGEDLFVKELTGKERDEFESSLTIISGKNITPNMSNARAKLVIKCLCDDKGIRVFDDADLEAVGAMPARELDKVFEVAQKMSGLKQADIEELSKNS